MAQYRTGTATVVKNSSTVLGIGTAWLSAVSNGDMFTIPNDNALYSVASVTSNTELAISAPYAGSNKTSVAYSIVTDFTPILNIPFPVTGDIETASIIQRAMTIIETAVQQLNLLGLYRGEWLTSTSYSVGDAVLDGAAGSGTNNIYYCNTAHTSGTFSTDLTAGNWSLLFNLEGIAIASELAAAASAADAATSAAEAEASAVDAAASAAASAGAVVSAAEAAASAAAAATSETNAATSASASSVSATSASSSASSAATSETNAASSASASAASATAASTSANDAAIAEVGAETAEGNAALSEANAAASAAEAATSEANAAASEAGVAADAAAATTAAADAATSETNAAVSAAAAAVSETNAAASAAEAEAFVQASFFHINPEILTVDYTLNPGINGSITGPIRFDPGVKLTVRGRLVIH